MLSGNCCNWTEVELNNSSNQSKKILIDNQYLLRHKDQCSKIFSTFEFALRNQTNLFEWDDFDKEDLNETFDAQDEIVQTLSQQDKSLFPELNELFSLAGPKDLKEIESFAAWYCGKKSYIPMDGSDDQKEREITEATKRLNALPITYNHLKGMLFNSLLSTINKAFDH